MHSLKDYTSSEGCFACIWQHHRYYFTRDQEKWANEIKLYRTFTSHVQIID